MALEDLAGTSQYGPNNPGQRGTGTVLGPNTSPLTNAPLGNPVTQGGVQHSELKSASHSSIYGPTNTEGQRGTGFIPDLFGNIPSELTTD
jgi:hypothetical protein